MIKICIVSGIVCILTLYLIPDVYDNCILSVSQLISKFDKSLDCYEMYWQAVECPRKKTRPILIVAAATATLTIVSFSLLAGAVLCSFAFFEHFAGFWGLSILISVIIVVLELLLSCLFYKLCKVVSN